MRIFAVPEYNCMSWSDDNRIIKLFLNYHIPVYVEIHNREPSISNRKYWQTYLDLLYSGYYRNSSNVAL